MTINTASNLEVLLHCYYSPFEHPRINAPSVVEGLRYLEAEGMIAKYGPDIGRDQIYETTEKGDVFIKYLMDIPFPVNTWSIPS